MAFSDDLMEAALAALKIDFSAKGTMFTVNERNILGIHLGLSLKKKNLPGVIIEEILNALSVINVPVQNENSKR